MEFRPKSTFEYRTSRNNKAYRCFNNMNKQRIIQSPKISSNTLRCNTQNEKLYSLNDINDKITNSKGPKLSKQYKRLSDKELKKFYGNDKLIGWNYDKLFINRYFKICKTSQNTFNKKIDNLDELQKKCDTKLLKSENNKNNEITNEKNTNNDKNKISIFKRAISQRNKKSQRIIPATTRKDIWMPKNFQKYDLQVKNPRMINTQFSSDISLKRIPSYSYKEICNKMTNTDIFFIKDKNKKNDNKRIKSSFIFSESDIFSVKNDKINLSKSGEKYLFKCNLLKKYTSLNESNSRWQPGVNYPNLINHHSTDYSILSPNMKNNTYIRTKRSIFEESKNINKNQRNDAYQKKILFFNPTHKQKGLAEFIDITKNGAENPGKDYVNKYKENPLCFQRNSEVCATFGDVYYNYKNVSTKPFMKERFES